jgi:hypothetical protein
VTRGLLPGPLERSAESVGFQKQVFSEKHERALPTSKNQPFVQRPSGTFLEKA